MSFYDDIEVRYEFCKEKANCLPPVEAAWYIAYAELAFLREANRRGHFKRVGVLLRQALEEMEYSSIGAIPKQTIQEALALLESTDK